jgi:hypothetical protein
MTLRIEGDITIEAFRDAVSNFLHLLREIEDSLAGEREVRWTLADLRHGSPALLTWEGTPRQRRRKRKKVEPTRDLAPVVAETLLHGVERLERGEGRPDDFSDDALDATLQLARVKMRPGITGISLIGENGALKEPRVLNVTERVAASVNEIIGPKYSAPGSVEGTLQAINSHGTLHFTIYDSVWGTRVRCDIPGRLKAAALAAFDERVLVTGIVARDAGGHPRHVKVETIDRVDSTTLPDSIRGIDPDFTGDLDSSDYLKRGWSGDA